MTGTLKRLVSGLTLEVTNIPAYVNSMTLIAEQLVTATRATDGTALAWQTAGDSGIKHWLLRHRFRESQFQPVSAGYSGQ